MRGNWKSFALFVIAIGAAASGNPASAAECKTLGRIASLDIKPLPSGRPSVEAKIVDSPVTMLIDTGGYVSSISSQIVRELKLQQTPNGRAIKMVNGAESNMLARLPSILIGGQLVTQNALYYVLPTDNPANTGRGEFDGILAGEFLKQFDADFDFSAQKLNLFSPDHCVGKVVYWQAAALAVVPMQIDSNNHIKLQVQLDGKKVEAILDTGASQSDVNLSDAQRMFRIDVNAPDVERVGALKGGFSSAIYRHRFKTLAFEGVTVQNPELLLFPDLLSGGVRAAPQTGSHISENRGLPVVTLGMSILRQLHLYVAFNERKLYITAAEPSGAAAPAAQ